MVQEELSKLGFSIERKKLDVPTHSIKMTGTYTIVAHLYENDNSHIKLIVQSEAEAKEALKKAQEAAAAEAKAKEEAEKAQEDFEEAVEEATTDEVVPVAEENVEA